MPLGRVNVLIGENGSGKSNILEAIAFLGAAAADKLDHEFLASRGVRVADDERLMCSAFPKRAKGISEDEINLAAYGDERKRFEVRLLPTFKKDETLSGWFTTPNLPPEEVVKILLERQRPQMREAMKKTIEKELGKYPEASKSWEEHFPKHLPAKFRKWIGKSLADFMRSQGEDIALRLSLMQTVAKHNATAVEFLPLDRFLVFSPAYDTLRRFDDEGQIRPLGIRGEGLFKLLQTFNGAKRGKELRELRESLRLLDWYRDLRLPKLLVQGERRIEMLDRFLGTKRPLDQRSANEGFLFLLFYFVLFISPATPPFFAIDNVDASLNPKLCAQLMRRLVELARLHGKQVILTTHNPALLDGLDLNDDEQRLFVVHRDEAGRTGIRRVPAPKPQQGELPMRLSIAFLRGLLGGLPKNF